jgi:hypothetical protein
MVSVFLRTELTSVRFEQQILSLLRQDQQDRSVVDTPDLSNAQENTYRMHHIFISYASQDKAQLGETRCAILKQDI